MLMTLPGIPVIYYGTEQGFVEQRGAMFAAGYASMGHDRFDMRAPLYRYLRRVIALRRKHRLFSRGTPTVLAGNAASAGVLAYRVTWDKQAALVVFNSAEHATLLDNLDTGFAPGTRLAGQFGIVTTPGSMQVGAGGRLNMVLPPRSGQVWLATQDAPRRVVAPPAGQVLSMDALPPGEASADFEVGGIARDLSDVRLVVDGDLPNAQKVHAGPDARWRATVHTGDMIAPTRDHVVVAWAPGRAPAVSQRRQFRVRQPWHLLARVPDREGDDGGPRGTYRYPTDDSWSLHHQADLRDIRIYGAGGAMQIELQMRDLTNSWNPANGFDHVVLTLFVQLPGERGGATVMPLQNAVLPEGMRWHFRLRTHGWNLASFSADGASATNEGTRLAAGATVFGDAATDTIRITLPAAALGNRNSLSGVRLYLNTWDYDGGYRRLGIPPQPQSFSGGHAGDPLLMDDIAVITLP